MKNFLPTLITPPKTRRAGMKSTSKTVPAVSSRRKDTPQLYKFDTLKNRKRYTNEILYNLNNYFQVVSNRGQ